jgi:hypothetical protein
MGGDWLVKEDGFDIGAEEGERGEEQGAKGVSKG